MARFPKREAHEQTTGGLAANVAIFPHPPHPAFGPGVGLRCRQNRCNPRRQQSVAAQAAAMQAEETLVDQLEKTQLEFRVIAINRVGEGPPSNTLTVVV